MNILVPIDGSKYSDNALNIAIEYAKAKNAEKYLLNVIFKP
ncbi:MAG TPA: universal stress protein [Nitrospirae bacterium]|nr:universal stress protein [Nitrospirota bacterium]